MDGTLRIPSVTGIDVELRIAGPGARSYAFLIDWHIRLLAAAAWMLVSALIYGGITVAISAAPDTGEIVLFVVTPAAALYLLYHPVLEVAMRGRTPGKRIAGVRILRRDGAVPGAGQLLVRNVFRIIDSLPLLYCVGLAAAILTRHSVRVGDIAAGTLLVYDREETTAPFADALPTGGIERLGLERAELVRDLLSRWPELDATVRVDLARRLLAKLGRSHDGGGEAELRASLEELLK